MKKIVIFVSGSGTNFQNIAEFFESDKTVIISCIYTNNPKSYAIERAKKLDIPCVIFSREQFTKTDDVLDLLKKDNPDFIVLAGFLWLIPVKIIKEFPNRIINIHPALLPKYGGKGMYGIYVHESVIKNNEKESGVTIHYVSELYDEGAIIFQTTCDVLQTETPETLAEKIHKLEYKYFPEVIKNLLL